MRFTLVRCLLIVLFSLRAAWSVPILVNPHFASGLTGWSTAGVVSTSTDTLLAPSPYAVLTSVAGVNAGAAEFLLGLTPGDLFGLTNISLVYQDIGGVYTAADSILAGVGGLTDNDVVLFPPNAFAMVGIVDLSNAALADAAFGPISSIGLPIAGTDGFLNAYSPDGGLLTLPASGQARLFALVAGATDGENSALAVTFLSEAPEIDPGSATLPVMMLLALFMLVAERRRCLPVPK